jgi:hypothetical protein
MAILGNTFVLLAHPAVPRSRLSYPLPTAAFDLGQVWFAATQTLMAFGVLGLVRSGAAGRGRVASAFGAAAVIGMSLKIPGELALILVASRAADSSAVSLASTPFGLGVLIADIGLIGWGVLVVRRGRWPRPWHALPTCLGLFELLVTTPVSLSLGFASPASYTVIVVADLLIAAIGIALIRLLPTPPATEPSVPRSSARIRP